MKRLLIIFYSGITIFLFRLTPAFASDTFTAPGNSNPVTQVQTVNPNDPKSITDANLILNTIWDRVLANAFALLGWLAVITLIWAGILYISSSGNKEQSKKALMRVIGAMCGIMILVAAYAIVNLLSGGGNLLAQWLSQ